jgi:hypothetical protein
MAQVLRVENAKKIAVTLENGARPVADLHVAEAVRRSISECIAFEKEPARLLAVGEPVGNHSRIPCCPHVFVVHRNGDLRTFQKKCVS